MNKALRFVFLKYELSSEGDSVFFSYKIEFSDREPIEFTETLKFPEKIKNSDPDAIKAVLEPLHLILGISYYKAYCPREVVLPYKLANKQAEFWSTVYKKGLGEFCYINNIDPKKIAAFPFENTTSSKTVKFKNSTDEPAKILVGIGGGKDSIVTAELLRNEKATSFLIETNGENKIARDVAEAIGNPIFIVKRELDKQLFDLKDAHNGHIPISAVYAFTGLAVCALFGYKKMVVSNEQSSNFGNLKYKGELINHQWSKSAEFEDLLKDYVKKYISSDILYYSELRQFYEIQIAKIFSKYPKYFHIFSSCNRSKNLSVKWCGECSKCAFVFLILAPFIERDELVKIFVKDLLEDTKLIPLYWDLLRYGSVKPFDCVGTFEEVRSAFATIKKSIKSVCIIGYGVEGKATEKYLKKYYPDLELGILDEKTDTDYLKKQLEYDVAIKTPGIPPRLVTIPYTTATNLFFARNKNFTIGITGSKGKSTATSLVYHILKTAGKKARLLGNIGKPMLEALMTDPDPDEIFVIELSSYMLEDIKYSPNIAVLLNLFPEHMNYHGSIEKYYEAKENIFKYQRKGDIALRFPFDEVDPLTHVGVATRVAKLLNISDEAIAKAIQTFKSLPYRLEPVGTFNGITFYDDSLATAPEPTILAIKKLKKVDTIFLGGEDRGYDFSELEKTLREYKVKNLVLFPDSGKRMIKSRDGFNILETSSMEEAVKFAYKVTRPGTICLLSCASPSYSLWKNYEEKGEEFKKFVKKL